MTESFMHPALFCYLNLHNSSGLNAETVNK